jgi:biotin carboxylase
MAAESASDENRSGPPVVRGEVAPLLILVGSGAQLYREYIVRAAGARYRLWLMHTAAPTWERPYLDGHTVVDNTDPDALVAAGREVAASHEVAGVFCYDEGLVWPAAHVVEALDLPGTGPEGIRACRDKALTRQRLAAAGVAQPASRAVPSLAEAHSFAAGIGYPVVLKPRGLAGSKGALRVDSADLLDDAYAAARAASYPGVPVYDAGVLVEEYLDGPEISVDAVFFEGDCVPLVVARKEVGFEPFFEETGHLVDAADPLLRDPDLRAELERIHAALGFGYGVSHTEFKLTGRGLRLIEVNARLGGDLIPYLGALSSGVDSALAAADAAAGRRPEPRFEVSRVAAIRFLYPPEDTEVDSVLIHQTDSAAVHQAVATAGPGDRLRLPPRGYISRYGFVTVVADTVEQAVAELRKAPQIVELKGRPLPAEDAR